MNAYCLTAVTLGMGDASVFSGVSPLDFSPLYSDLHIHDSVVFPAVLSAYRPSVLEKICFCTGMFGFSHETYHAGSEPSDIATKTSFLSVAFNGLLMPRFF